MVCKPRAVVQIHAGAMMDYPRMAPGLGSKVGPMLGLRARSMPASGARSVPVSRTMTWSTSIAYGAGSMACKPRAVVQIHAGAMMDYPRVVAGLGSKVGPMLRLRARSMPVSRTLT